MDVLISAKQNGPMTARSRRSRVWFPHNMHNHVVALPSLQTWTPAHGACSHVTRQYIIITNKPHMLVTQTAYKYYSTPHGRINTIIKQYHAVNRTFINILKQIKTSMKLLLETNNGNAWLVYKSSANQQPGCPGENVPEPPETSKTWTTCCRNTKMFHLTTCMHFLTSGCSGKLVNSENNPRLPRMLSKCDHAVRNSNTHHNASCNARDKGTSHQTQTVIKTEILHSINSLASMSTVNGHSQFQENTPFSRRDFMTYMSTATIAWSCLCEIVLINTTICGEWIIFHCNFCLENSDFFSRIHRNKIYNGHFEGCSSNHV